MKKIILVDSCCNLPPSFYHENSEILDMISMPIHLGKSDFLDDHGKTVTYKDFYDQMRAGIVPSTSQISPADFYDRFEKLHQDGYEILSISFSSGMSGTFNNSVLAHNMIKEDYPDAKITLIDSYCASVGYGVIVMKAIGMMKAGQFDQIPAYIEENKTQVNHFFTVQDLMFLKNGGRIPPALATVGTLLNLKPMMDVDMEGKLRQLEKVRGRKRVYRYFIEAIEKNYNPELSPIIIGHGNCEEDAETLKKMIQDQLGHQEIIVTEESPTIGSHVGPGLLVIGFIGNLRG